MRVWKEGNNVTIDEEIGASNYQITLDDFKVLTWNGSNEIGVFDERTTRTAKDSFSNVKDKSGAVYGSTLQDVFNALNSLSEVVIQDPITGEERVPEVITVTTNGSTKAGVQNVGLIYYGSGGTMDGEEMEDGEGYVWNPNKGEDTVGPVAYTVPTGGKIRIHYLNS